MESNGGSGEAPARCVFVAATAWQSTSGPDPMFTPLGGAFGCSGIAAKDPAWRRPSWCGGVRLFILFQRRVTPKFFDDYKSVKCGWVLLYCFDFVAVLCGVVTTGPLEVVSSSPRVDDPIQPS